MDRVYKEFKEAKMNTWPIGIELTILIIVIYYSFTLSSYVMLGVCVIGGIFIGFDFYTRYHFNTYLKSQKLLVKENPELVMKNLSELVTEMIEQNKKFEEEAFALGNRSANELIEDKKRRKRKQRKEVYDIVLAIKNYIRKENNIKL